MKIFFAIAVILLIGGLAVFNLSGNSDPDVIAAAPADDIIVVYKSPTCGCCGDWIDHLESNGFAVEVHDRDDMNSVKSLLGVPAQLASCHTATVGGYVIEGHVAAAEIERLLQERPKAHGLAVPGMPIGSPGMEMGDTRMKYETLLFSADQTLVFARHGE